jgi:1,4-dihydroxy-2-naphthoate octaprenyltransferase
MSGDRHSGIVTLAVALGEKGTRTLLWILLGAIEVLALATLWQTPASHAAPWRIVALSAPLYLGGLLLAIRRPRSERFYEWWVEGILFLPALAIIVARA